MKKIALVIILCSNFIALKATTISRIVASKVALNYAIGNYDALSSIKNFTSIDSLGQPILYVVSFFPKGWIILPACNNIFPVLSASSSDYIVDLPSYNEPINISCSFFKDDVFQSIMSGVNNPVMQQKWIDMQKIDYFVGGSGLKSGGSTNTLLDVPGRGAVRWEQSSEEATGCNSKAPMYNMFCPSANNDMCGKSPAGCGAVAMAQIMWYWKWPKSSMYRTYDWNLMPVSISLETSMEQGQEIANLLRDCGRACNMKYEKKYSWAFTYDVESAFADRFEYNATKLYDRKDWKYGSSWSDLIRSEIDNKRPVLYRGDKSALSGDKHYFIIHGYSKSDPDLFDINLGYGFNNNALYLGNITDGDNGPFNKVQMAIVGISPTYKSVLPQDVYEKPIVDLDINAQKDAISTPLDITAINSIVLPTNNGKLSVTNTGSLSLIAGNFIELNSGFNAELGSQVMLNIEQGLSQPNMDIYVPAWPNTFTPNGDGINDQFCMAVYNADSWEFMVYKTDNGVMNPIFQSAGSIENNEVCMWAGQKSICVDFATIQYYAVIRFKNSFGRAVEKQYMIYTWCPSKK